MTHAIMDYIEDRIQREAEREASMVADQFEEKVLQLLSDHGLSGDRMTAQNIAGRVRGDFRKALTAQIAEDRRRKVAERALGLDQQTWGSAK